MEIFLAKEMKRVTEDMQIRDLKVSPVASMFLILHHARRTLVSARLETH